MKKTKKQRKKYGSYTPKEDAIYKLSQYLKLNNKRLIELYTEETLLNDSIDFNDNVDFNQISKTEILNRYFKYFDLYSNLEIYDDRTIHQSSLNSTKNKFPFYYCNRCNDLSKYNIYRNSIICRKCEQTKCNNWMKNKLYECDIYRFIHSARSTISIALKNQGYKKNTKTSEILGCNWDVFKLHIERKFLDGMSWQNYGKWHLDHIYPISKATSYEMALELNHYTNFQPLWAFDNISKHDKIIEHQRIMPF